MTVDLEQRGRDAASSLRSLVDTSIDESALAIALDATLGRAPRPLPVRETTTAPRRGRFVAALAVAAAVALVVFVAMLLTRRDDREPIQPTPTPTEPTAVEAPTTTAAPPLPPSDPATTNLESIGPELGFEGYPPTALALRDGRVLKLGATFGGPNRVDVLDPTTGVATTLGTTLVGRSFPTLVLLGDDRLLIAGGDMSPPVVTSDGTTSSPADANTGEVFDLTTGTSVSAGPMVSVRYIALGALLPDGTVLVVGNASDAQGLVETPVAELYDPTTNSFRRTGDRTVTEQPLELLAMSDGRVLVFGLHSEIFDPSTGTFTGVAGTPADPPSGAVMLPDGTVLAIEGRCSELDSLEEQNTLEERGYTDGRLPVGTERFDPRTGQFTPGADLPHCVTTAVTMPDGRVFVAGYWYSTDVVLPDNIAGPGGEQTWSGILDPATGITTITPNPNRRDAKAVVTTDGQVLLVAGAEVLGGTLTWADRYP